jgi:hypothetical protein
MKSRCRWVSSKHLKETAEISHLLSETEGVSRTWEHRIPQASPVWRGPPLPPLRKMGSLKATVWLMESLWGVIPGVPPSTTIPACWDSVSCSLSQRTCHCSMIRHNRKFCVMGEWWHVGLFCYGLSMPVIGFFSRLGLFSSDVWQPFSEQVFEAGGKGGVGVTI